MKTLLAFLLFPYVWHSNVFPEIFSKRLDCAQCFPLVTPINVCNSPFKTNKMAKKELCPKQVTRAPCPIVYSHFLGKPVICLHFTQSLFVFKCTKKTGKFQFRLLFCSGKKKKQKRHSIFFFYISEKLLVIKSTAKILRRKRDTCLPLGSHQESSCRRKEWAFVSVNSFQDNCKNSFMCVLLSRCHPLPKRISNFQQEHLILPRIYFRHKKPFCKERWQNKEISERHERQQNMEVAFNGNAIKCLTYPQQNDNHTDSRAFITSKQNHHRQIKPAHLFDKESPAPWSWLLLFTQILTVGGRLHPAVRKSASQNKNRE